MVSQITTTQDEQLNLYGSLVARGCALSLLMPNVSQELILKGK